jgi:predicted PurR-regulated permease PerM
VGIADHVFRPVLIGSATRLPFLWVLIGILGGVEMMGLLGLFVGPATMATLILLWRDYFADGVIDGSGRPASPAGPPPPDCG